MGAVPSRRTVLAGASWTVPSLAIAAMAPASATSLPQDESCPALKATSLPRWEGMSLSLVFAEPAPATLAAGSWTAPDGSRVSVPPRITIANTGTLPLPAGTPVTFTAFRLDEAGIVRSTSISLALSAARAVTLQGRVTDGLVRPEVSSPRSTLFLVLACPVNPGEEPTAELVWQRDATLGAKMNCLQCFARMVTDASESSYTEFPSQEVVGGMALL